MSGGNLLGRRRMWLVMMAWAMVVSIATVVLTGRPAAAACDDITVTTGQGGSGVAAAIDEANACDGFLTIFIEPGTYSWGGSTITDTVTITAADPALPPILTGAGQGGSQFSANSASGTVTLERLVVQGGFRAGLISIVRSEVVLDGVSFVGSTTTCGISTANAIRLDAGDLTMQSSAIGASGCSGILGFNSPRVTLDDVEIAAMAQHGVRTDGPLTVTNSRIHDNGLTGITLSGTDSATISGSAIYANGDDGIGSSPTPLTVRNSVIGLEPDGAGGLVPAGNRDMGIDARFAEVTIENVVVAHNRRGVSLANVTSTISGSEIRDHANVGLSLSRTTATVDTTDLRDNSPTDCGLFLSTIVDSGGNTDSDDTCGFAQPNSAPTADVDRYQTDEDIELNVTAPGVLEGDDDPDGDQITAELVTGPANASTFELFSDGSFDYVPALDYYGVDTFAYRATDGALTSPPTIVEIVVRPVNDAPTISAPGNSTVDLDTVVPIPIVVGDIDADDPPGEEDAVVPVAFVIADAGTLSFDESAHPEVVATFGGGQTQLFLDGEIGPLVSAASTGISWQPDAGFEGTATFDASIRDRGENGVGDPLQASASFEITVADLNQPPVAGDDDYGTREDTLLVVAAPGVLANDSDPDGDPLEASVVDEPTLGTVDVGVDGSFTYSPDPDANGTDTFTYVASDGSLDSDPATVTIDIESVSEPWTLDLPSEVVTDEDVPVVFTGLLTDVDELVTAIAAGTTLGTVDVAGPAPDGTVTFTFTPDPNVSGTDTISIGVTDVGGTTLEFVSLVVDPVNDPPVITAPADVATDEDSPVSFDLTVSDVETAADALSVSVTTPPAVGTVSRVGPDALGIVTVTFAPAPDANGAPLGDLTIEVDDGTDSSSASVAVAVAPVNDAPVAAPDAYTTDEDVELSVAAPGVLGNDSDVDTAVLAAVVETAPANGTVVLAADGGFTYTPDPQFSGSDSFTYRATDGVDVSIPVVATITVNAVNDVPTIAGPGEMTTDEDVTATFTVSVADVETAAADLAVTADVPPAVGTVAVSPIAADGSVDITLTPAADVNGEALGPITVVVDDGDDAAVLDVDVTIDPVDDLPVAAGDEYTAQEDTQLVVGAPGVLANDADVDGDPIAARLIAPPATGALVLQADGSFTYTPAPDAFGDVTFTYVAEDAGGASDAVEVTITIEPVDDPPEITGPATTSFDEDTLATVAVTVSDPDTALVDLVVSADLPPSVGTTAIAGPDATGQVIVTIDPNPDLNGDPVGDLVVTVSDDMSSVDLVVSVTIAPVNDAPVGEADAYTTDEDSTLTIAAPGVLANDTDVDGDPLTATLATDVANGTLTLDQDGGFIYTPEPGFAGTDTFTYGLSDGTVSTGPITFTIDVLPVNDPPIGVPDSYATTEDVELVVGPPGVLINDTDPDGDPLSAALDTDPTIGTVTLDPDGGFTYTPDLDTNGTDTFTYTATDGTETSGPITVTIDVTPINDAPIGNPDTYTTDEDTTLTIAAPGVLANDTDPDGDPLSTALDTEPSNGIVTLDPEGSFTYTPAPDTNGTDTFTYTATDGVDIFGPITVTINVAPLNDGPVGLDDAYTTDEDTTLTIAAAGVLANDTDIDGDPLSAALDIDTTSGALALDPDGGFTYTPDPDTNGTDTFTYTASDGTLSTEPITVTIDVTPVNDPPVAVLTVAPDPVVGRNPVTADASASSDPDGDVVTYRYDWGDGRIEESVDALLDHSYAAPGTYTVELVVVDDGGLESEPVKVTLEVLDPVVTINTERDAPDQDPGDGSCWTGGFIAAGEPECSFRAAVEEANGRGEPAEIVVPNGNYRLDLGAVQVDVRVTVTGTGRSTTWISDPGTGTSHLRFTAGGSLTDLTMAAPVELLDGDFTVSAGIVASGPTALAVADTATVSADGLDVAGGSTEVSGALSGVNVQLAAPSYALRVIGGTVVLDASRIIGDISPGLTTEVRDGGRLELYRSEISGNSEALHVGEGSVLVDESVLSGGPPGRSLVFLDAAASVEVFHSTLDGFVEDSFGGSLLIESSTVNDAVSAPSAIIRWSTVRSGVYMSAGEIAHSAIDRQTPGSASCVAGSSVVLLGNVDSGGGCGGETHDDLRLAPLADNGGPTPTMLPRPGSPLIDAGPGSCPTTDQRGVLRPIDGELDGVAVCDVGAIEAPELAGENPVAALVASPEEVLEDQLVTFDAGGSADPDGSIATYEFDFGDGTTLITTEPIVEHRYDVAGTYVASVAVTDQDDQLSAPATATVVVEPYTTTPIARLEATPLVVGVGEPVTFDASGSTDADGTIVAYGFDLGDGATVSGSEAIVAHSYDTPGVFVVTVTVADDDQQVSLPATVSVVVQTAPLTADLDVDPPVAAVGATVTADGSGSMSPDSTIVSYTVDWGDGITVETGDQPTGTHSYDAPGDYTVTLTVEDALGVTSPPVTATVQIYGDALVVNTTIDEPDLDPADGICFTGAFIATSEPACSLRAAVEEANARGVPAVIVLPAGTFDTGSSIVRAEVELTLVGAGRDLTTVGVGPSAYSVLLSAGGTVTDLTFGSRLVAFGTSLHVENVVATDSTGLLVTDDGDLTAVDVEATGFSTALDVRSGSATVHDSIVRSLSMSGGAANLTNVDVQNSFVGAGELAMRRGELTVASVAGGTVGLDEVNGVVVTANGQGADVSIRRSTLATVSVGPETTSDVSVDSSTISNTITALSGTVSVTSSTVRFGVSTDGPTSIVGSAIGAVGSGTSCALSAATPTLTDNIDVDGSCGGGAVGDLLLGPLADNGGPTLTYLPLPGSPLVDAAGTACPARDQRGAPRPIDGNDDTTVACDAGAVEAPSGSGGPMPPAQIDVEIRFAGAPVDDEPFDVDVELVASSGADVAELVPLAVEPDWPGTTNGCGGGLLDSTGERPTCSGTFTIAADAVVDVDVVAVNNGGSPYPTFTGDCGRGSMTVGRGVALTCTITFVRPDIGDSDPAESTILRLDKRWIAPLATELPEATIGIDVLFGGFTADIPVADFRNGQLDAGTCAVPTDCEYYVAFRPAPLDLGVTIPDLVVVEEELPDGWQAFFGDDCPAGRIDDPQPGDLLTCTITNVEAAGPSPVLVEWYIEPVGSVLPLVEVEADLRFVPADGGDDLFASVDQALPPVDQPGVACEWIEPGVGDYPLACRTVLDAAPGDYAVEITTPEDDVWRRSLRDGCLDGQLTTSVGAVAICRVDLRKVLPERYVDFSASTVTPVVPEGDDERDAGVVDVVVTFDRPLTSEIELPWEIVPASATDAPDGWPMGDFTSSDVAASEGVLTIPVGAAEARLQVEFVADQVVEPDDGFAVRITEPTLGGVVSVFGAIRNDDTAPTLEGVTATPDAGIYPLTITGQAVGGSGEIAGYRWWLRAPSGSTELFETTGATIELDLTEVGTFELRAAALDDAGNASHDFFDAPSTTIEVEDRVPVIEVDEVIVAESDGNVFLRLLEDVDVVTAPGRDWSVRFASLPTGDPGPGGAAPATPGDVSPWCGTVGTTDFQFGLDTSFRLDRDGRFSRGPTDDPTFWDEFRLLWLCDDSIVEGLEYRRLAVIGWPVDNYGDTHHVLGEFNLFIVDDDDGDVRPIIETPEVVTVSVPIGTTPPVEVAWTATATDPEDGELDVTCDPASGSAFGFGTTTVTCTAIDSAFHMVEDPFDVVVAEADDATVGDLAGAPVTRVPAGTAVRVRGGGYADGSDARIELRSDPVVLAERVVENGSVDAVVSIPPDTPTGEHTLVIVGTGADGTPRQTVLRIVVEDPGCTITGTPGRDLLFGTRFDDVICGLGGDDLILGGRGADLIIAGDGDDIVFGGRGADGIYGGAGADALFGEQGDDVMSGGEGDDLVLGGAGDDTLAGGPGDDTLIGGRGNDLLIGAPGRDRLLGRPGRDELID